MREVVLIAFGSLIGLVTSIAGRLFDSAKEKRTRWDDERLRTYASFMVAVRAAGQRAGRLVKDGITTSPHLDEYVRDRLREESFAYEQIQLIGTDHVRESAQRLSETLRNTIRDWSEEANWVLNAERQRFFEAVREELSIK